MIKAFKYFSNFKILFAISIIIFSPSCASQEEKIELIKQEVEVIIKKLNDAEMINGMLFSGERKYVYRAYFEDDELIYIFTDIYIGSRSASTNYYYFKNNNLIFANINEVGYEGLKTKKKRSLKMDVYFDGDKVLDYSKSLGNNYDVLTEDETNQILSEVKKLYNRAIEKRQATKNT